MRVFHKLDEIGNNANIGIRGFTTCNLHYKSNTLLYELTGHFLVRLRLQAPHSPALLIPTKSSKSKNQVVHKQKFKDTLSNTCLISLERRMLDLESDVN